MLTAKKEQEGEGATGRLMGTELDAEGVTQGSTRGAQQAHGALNCSDIPFQSPFSS